MKTLDFDKFIGEKDHEFIEVKIFGKKYKVKKFIPAIVPILMARAERCKTKKEKQEISTKLVMMSIDAFLGNKAVDEICSKGITIEEITKIVEQLFLAINNNSVDDENEEESITDDDSFKVKESSKKSQ